MSAHGEAVCSSRYLVHSGYMSKQGRVFKTWKKRYFQLYNDGTLTYKHDAGDEHDKLGIINVKCAAIESDGKCIKILTSSRTLCLKCSTTYEAQVWTGGLTRSSTQNLSVSGDQGIFIELTWRIQDTKRFLEHEKLLCENVARNSVHAITFLAWQVSDDGQGDRRWTCIFSSQETLSKVFSSVIMDSCISHGRIAQCNVGGKICASLVSQSQGKQHFLEACGIRNCRVGDVPVVCEEPTATCFILNPLASFLPSKGILYRLSYTGSKDLLEIIAQIQSSLAYVARTDYPGVLCYHCYKDELPDYSTILHILQVYANNGVMETFFRDDQVKRLHANMKKFSTAIKQVDATCWYDTNVAPRNSFLPQHCSRQVRNSIGETFRTSDGFCLHRAPAFPANMKHAVGWMRKRRRKQDPWKLRFFIVNPGGTNLMRYYLDPGSDLKGKGERGSFSLENLVIYLHGGARSAMLTLSSSKEPQTMTLHMRTSAEYFRWLQDLTSYAGTIYNLDREQVIVGQKPKNKIDTFNIDNLAVSAIALQLDQLTTGLNDTGASHRSGHSRCVTEDPSDHRVRKWCMAYTYALNTIMAMEDTAVADTIIWFQRKLVKYFKKHFDIEAKRRMPVTEEIMRALYNNAKEVKKIVRRRTSTSFKDWLEKEYSADPNETFSGTCSRHADSVRFFIECVYEMLKDDHEEVLDRYYKELRELYNTRDEEEVDDLHIMTTVIAVERRVLNPIYDYVEFFVTCTDDASSVDAKIILLREKLRKVCNDGGITIEEVFEAVPSESGWDRSVKLLNTLETLRQPAEMLSRFMAVMMSMTETYLVEEKIRNPEVDQPDPLGADDVVPILLAIVTRCNLKKTQTIFQMMSNVGSAYISTGRTKYYLTMFESVLYYLTTKGEKLLSDLNARNMKSAINDISQGRSSVMLSYEEDLSFGHLSQEARIKQMLDHLEERIERLDGRIYAVQRLMRLNEASLVLMSGRRRRRKSNFFSGPVGQTEKVLPAHTTMKNL